MADSQSSLTTTTSGSLWTREQDKDFENALNVVDEETPDRWERIAAMVAGKDAAEVKRHYDILQEDVLLIDSGRVAVPNYSLSSLSLLNGDSPTSDSKKGGATIPASAAPAGNNGNGGPARTVSSRSADQERRKGIPWSEDEHRYFHFRVAMESEAHMQCTTRRKLRFFPFLLFRLKGALEQNLFIIVLVFNAVQVFAFASAGFLVR